MKKISLIVLFIAMADTLVWAQAPLEEPLPGANTPEQITDKKSQSPKAADTARTRTTSEPEEEEAAYEYESSEEISEDLSVSFPVDI